MERRSNIDEGQDLIDELKSQVEDETSANEKRKKLLTLLPDRETNLEKMSQIVLKNKDKLAGMRQRWTAVESELESDYISLCRTIEQKQVGMDEYFECFHNVNVYICTIYFRKMNTNRRQLATAF